MKALGVVLLIVGAIAFVFAFRMDTTVGSYHNIGLLNDRQNTFIFGGALAVIGAVFVGFGSISRKGREESAAPAEATRKCPFCAEIIKAEAKICRFCQRELPPLSGPSSPQGPAEPSTVIPAVGNPRAAWTPQHEALADAILHDRIATLHDLISEGVDPTTPNPYGYSCLDIARNCHREDLIELMTSLMGKATSHAAGQSGE